MIAPTTEQIEAIYAAAEKEGPDVKLYETPDIALKGYISFSAGQSIFPILAPSGREPASMVFYLTRGKFVIPVNLLPHDTADRLASRISLAAKELRAFGPLEEH